MARPQLPADQDNVRVRLGRRTVPLTNLGKSFWDDLGLTKRDLLQYYLDVSPALLPHIEDRPMVMKRYPDGIDGEYFFMKRAPEPRPEWIETCPIEHTNAGVVEYPLIQGLASLMWVINLGCIDLNPWYGRCDDVDRPDFLHFDLDPVPGSGFGKVRDVSLILREVLETLGMTPFAKTTGSRGIHVYVAIERGPLQKEVWTVAKAVAVELASRHPKLITAEYLKSKRPEGRVLVDYNQNAWGKTLASVYSVRPKPSATVSTPVTWKEIEEGIEIEDFTVSNVPDRIEEIGDLWEPLLGDERFDLGGFIEELSHG